jgi:hypothetical protein
VVQVAEHFLIGESVVILHPDTGVPSEIVRIAESEPREGDWAVTGSRFLRLIPAERLRRFEMPRVDPLLEVARLRYRLGEL